MAEGFTKETLKMVVSQVCQAIGWHAIQTTSLEVLVDVMHRYLEEIAKTSHLYADQFGRTRPNLDDLGLTFSAMGIEIRELEEYIEYVESVPCNYHVPKYPVAKESHLNFLKPGSKEVVTRPVHVHEHLPPTIPETEEAYPPSEASLAVDTEAPSATPSPQASPQGVFKRPGDPVDSPAAKRARLFLEEEGRPLREISSVMMTTGGFLSPAREGKLPEPKVVLPTSDSRAISPQPSSYPAVPPEVNREKKAKKAQDSSKGEKKDKKKAVATSAGPATGPDKLDLMEEPAIKKLASMKEMEKLKALKTGALKMGGRYGSFQTKAPKPGSNKVTAVEHVTEKSLIQKLSESPHLVVTPVQPSSKKQSPPSYEKTRDSGVTIAKLTTEPDVQKLNIFKKITKVKEEKVEKLEKHDFADIMAPQNKERSPGLIIEEVPNRRPRSALSEMMESLPKDKKESRQMKMEPRTPDISQIYEDTLSSPGSPSTPKTPDIMRKSEKSPEHKKKKKDKDKRKKKGSPKDRTKLDEEGERGERPKTPEVFESPRMRDGMPAPVLPFFPHFPSGPGLIPPPITNPLIPRFPHPLCPNFPNLPLPPPLLMQQQQLLKPDDFKKEAYERSDSSSPIKSEKEGKSALAILLNREKKLKESKKDKKDRDKIKKKKDKKEKMKKEKGEKKHRDKEDKHKERKSKDKKEKKTKKKEKLKEAAAAAAAGAAAAATSAAPSPVVVSVPKLTLKLGPSSPRPVSPDPKLKKLLGKPPKVEDEDKSGHQVKREPTPEIARISALFNKPSKASVTKPLHVQTETSKGSTGAPLMKSPGTIIDKDGNKVWICPACGRPDDGSAMIGCDECDAWYHWVCVGIQVPPDKNEDWYCRFCIVKKQGTHTEKKKRGRKKKPPV